ncbi:MAG: hypothetical protein U0869_15980 [Chloroflexota bacterium]
MIRASRAVAAASLLLLLAGSTGAAQESSPATATCPLIAAADVAAALDGPPMTTDTGDAYHCSFSAEGLDVYLSVQPGADMAALQAQAARGEAVTVGGHDGWWVRPNELYLDADGQILDVSAYHDGEDGTQAGDDSLKDPLGAIALGALPNLPAPPDAQTVAALEAFIPATFGEAPITTYAYTGGMIAATIDPTDRTSKLLLDALAAQGRSLSDLLAVTGRSSEGQSGVLIIKVAGADASALLVPLAAGFSASEPYGAVTTVEMGGKTVSVLPMDSPVHAYAAGDTAFYASAPDAWMETFFAGLP